MRGHGKHTSSVAVSAEYYRPALFSLHQAVYYKELCHPLSELSSPLLQYIQGRPSEPCISRVEQEKVPVSQTQTQTSPDTGVLRRFEPP